MKLKGDRLLFKFKKKKGKRERKDDLAFQCLFCECLCVCLLVMEIRVEAINDPDVWGVQLPNRQKITEPTPHFFSYKRTKFRFIFLLLSIVTFC